MTTASAVPAAFDAQDASGPGLAPATLRAWGLADIVEQRRHQVEDEGFTPEQDRGYEDGELVRAALWFLTGDAAHCPWPGTRHVPGKKGRLNDLAKAGAFIAAEIGRLRAAEDGR